MISIKIKAVTGTSLVLGATSLFPLSAFAHSQTQSTIPKANAVLSKSPSSVQVTLNEPILSSGAALVVRSSNNLSVTSGKPKISGKTISVALLPNLESSTYRVSYRVVSNDGHVVTSSYKFTIKK